MKLFDLSGRTALITGSSKGIGFALAGALASAGARVVLNARDEARLAQAQQALQGQGYQVDVAAFDVLDYDIELTSIPDRQWIDGRAKVRLKARQGGTGQLTIKLADSLTVRSLTSDRFGRLFFLRVSNQNTLLINLPSILNEDEEITLTVSYVGRLAPQSPDRETLDLAQDEPGGQAPPMSFPDDMSIPRAEPSFLYSNRSFWHVYLYSFAIGNLIWLSIDLGRTLAARWMGRIRAATAPSPACWGATCASRRSESVV